MHPVESLIIPTGWRSLGLGEGDKPAVPPEQAQEGTAENDALGHRYAVEWLLSTSLTYWQGATLVHATQHWADNRYTDERHSI